MVEKNRLDADRSAWFEAVADAMLLLSEDGEISDANPEACRLLGRPRATLVGLHCGCLFDASDPRLGRAFEERDRTGRFRGDLNLLREDGSAFPAEVSLALRAGGSGVVFRESEGQGLREGRLRALIRNSSDVCAILDRDGTVCCVSPSVERVLGFRPEEMLGKNAFDYVHPEDAASLSGAFEAAPGAGSLPLAGFRLRDADGSWRHFEATGANMTGDPAVQGIFVNAREVTAREAAETDRQDAEFRYRTLVEQIPAVVYVQEPGSPSKTTYISPQFEAMQGYSPEEVLESEGHWTDTLHPEDRERVLAEDERTNATGETFDMEYRQIGKDGRVVWVHDRAVFVPGVGGRPGFWQGVLFDFTDRKRDEWEIRQLNADLESRVANRNAQLQAFVAELQRGEKVLRESEERFRASFEQAAVGIAHVSLLSRWTKVNDRLCQILGYTEEEMLRLGFQEVTHPDDLDADFGRFKEVLAGKLRTYSVEKRYVRKDGQEVWVNQTLSVVRDTSGRPTYFVCVVEDITDRRLAGDTMRESEERFRSLVQNTSDIISVCDADGTILYESPSVERVLGFRPEEMLGKNAFDYVHPEDAERVLSLSHLARDQTLGRPMELRCRHKDGSWRYLEVISDDLLDNPSVRGIVVSSRDITERKRTNEALRRSVDVLLALSEAGQVLGSTLELEEICSRLLTIMRRVSGLTAAVISIEDELGQPRIWREVGLKGLWRRARYAPQAEEARRAVLDAGEHRLFRLRGPEGADRLVGLYLPLRMKNRIAGVLEAYGPESLAGEDAVEILRSLAAQAASALENARLYGELAEREARLKELVGKLLTAQEEERRRVAYEVHDGLTQVAVSSYQHLQAFAEQHPPGSAAGQEMLDRSLDLIRRAVGEARRVIADLRPTALDDFGLNTALRLQVEYLNDMGWQIGFSSGLGAGRLPVAVETALYRVAQEALTNVRKHSGASAASVEIGRANRSVRLRIEDRGKGFDARIVPSAGGPGERIGLSSMRERVELVGGELEIRSEEGAGTTVTARVPLPNEEDADMETDDPIPTQGRK